MEINDEVLDSNVTARRKGKDSVFLNLFHIPQYTVELVKALHPNLKINESDVQTVSLQSILLTKPYNDLGVLVKGKLLIFAEAQSTWSVNVVVRILLYLVMTYHDYLKENSQLDVYGSPKISLPKPEFYVIYTGDKKDCPSELSLAEEFFDGDAPVDLSVKVLTKAGTEDIIQQYIRFCKVFDEQRKKHGYTLKTILETIRICQNENVLREYLTKQAKEVQTIMITLFSQEEAMKRHDNTTRNEIIIENIKKIMEKFHLTEEEAMDTFDIPQENRSWLMRLMSEKIN